MIRTFFVLFFTLIFTYLFVWIQMSEKLEKELVTSRKFYLKYISVKIKFLMGVIWNYFINNHWGTVCN